MRWLSVLVVLVVTVAPAIGQGMPQVDAYYDTGSDILTERMEVAEDYLDQAGFTFQRSEFTLANFLLTDAEFELQQAIEFGLDPDHPAAAYIRDGIAKVRADMEEWGADEADAAVAAAWWNRIFEEHAKLAAQLLDWVDEGAMLNAEELYWIPPYFAGVITPELAEFQAKYPDRAAFVALVPDADVTVGAGWSQAPTEDADKDRFAWIPEIIARANGAMEQYVIDSLAELETFGREKVLAETGEGYPLDASAALDAARVILSRQPENETAQKIHDKAMEYLQAFWDENRFNIAEMVMPEDVAPDDADLHAAMQAAYASEATEQGWNDQVLRVVVTSPFAEGWEAWWVENVLHVGYFKRITGAVAVQQAEGCRVMRCLFRQQRLDDGTFGPMYLGKVITSYPILAENVNP